jgi:LPPG:FO 2-phospho-L-lactate transferase
VGPAWFALGDRDIATHVVRTQMLGAGYPLGQVTEALCTRWGLPRLGVRLLPMSDDRVETHVVIDTPDEPSPRRAVHFQEYWVRARDVHRRRAAGQDAERAGAAVVVVLRDGDGAGCGRG